MSEQTQIHNQEPDPQFTQRFIDAIGSVNTYNERHTGIGGAMKGLIAAMLTDVTKEAEQPKVSHAEEAEMQKELVQLLQTDELGEMGITLFDTKAPGIKKAELSGEETEERPSTLIMLITDGDKFAGTLYRLKPTAEQQEQTAKDVATLLSSPVSLIQAFYPKRDPEDENEAISPEAVKVVIDHQLDLFMELNPALVSQGFANSEAYKTLSEYTARYSSGTLPEYREAEAQGLLSVGFGPSAWVQDIGPKGLNQRWTESFELLKSMRDREEPSPFFTELFTKLRADFDTARDWLDNVQTYGDEYDQAYAEWQKQNKRREEELDAELDRKGLSKAEKFGAMIQAGAEAPQPPKPPEGAYPNYIVGLREEMDKLAPEWERSFALENAVYLSEKEGNKGNSEHEK